MLGRFPRRNRFISDYIYRKTGKLRTAKQVGSRLQQLRETCGGNKCMSYICILFDCFSCLSSTPVLSLLSPIPRRNDNPSDYSSSSDTSCANSPVTPAADLAFFSTWSHATEIPRVLVYIDILPDDVPYIPTGQGRHWPTSNGSQLSSPRVVRASEHPRHLRCIDPTVTFLSRSAVSAQCRFTVYSGGIPEHSESTNLVLLEAEALSGVQDGFLYSTSLVPNYWTAISASAGKYFELQVKSGPE